MSYVDEPVPLAVVYDQIAGSVTVTNPAGRTILRAPADSLGRADRLVPELGYRLTGVWHYRDAPTYEWVNTGEAIPPETPRTTR